MLEFKVSADPHSLDVKRDGKRLGFLHWHPDRVPHLSLWPGDGLHVKLTMEELRQTLRKYELVKKRRK